MANLNNIFNPLFLKNRELKIALELLFFAIKDFFLVDIILKA